MDQTKKIKKSLLTIWLILLVASCGTKNYGSVYYAGKMKTTIVSAETTDYRELNKILTEDSGMDSTKIHLDFKSKEEIAIDDVVQDLLKKQNSKLALDSTGLNQEKRVPIVIQDTVPTVLHDSIHVKPIDLSIENKDFTEPITLHDTIRTVYHDSIVIQHIDSSQVIKNKREPVYIRDTIHTVFKDSLTVRNVDSVRVVNQVTITDTIYKTVVQKEQINPTKEDTEIRTEKKFAKTENNTKEKEQKTNKVIPIIIPSSKIKKDSIPENELTEKIDTTMSDTLVVKEQIIDSTELLLKKNFIAKVDSSLLMKPKSKSDRIVELEQKLEQYNKEILSRLNQLIELKTVQEKTVIPPTKEPKATEVKSPSKKVVFFFQNNATSSQNETELIQEVIEFANKNKNVQLHLSSFTDASGSAKLNLNLSKKRALHIQQELIRNGVDPKTIFVQYFGSKYAVPLNPDSQRRVECLVKVMKE